MKFAMALVGSRGDVQPGLAVALDMQRRGHRVALGVAPNLLSMATDLGLDAVPVGVDSRDLLSSSLVRSDMRSSNPRTRVRALREVAAHGWSELRDGLSDLTVDADVVVTGLLGQEVGAAVAEARGAAFAALHYCPVRANSVVSLVPVGAGWAPARRAAWRAGEGVRWALTRRAENDHRAALGLPAAVVDLPQRLRDRGALEIQAYDEVLVPGLGDEWGVRRPLVGALGLPSAATTSEGEDLVSWIEDGDAPVYVGFGSMPVPDPAAVLSAVAEMCEDLGVRAVVSAGWSEIAHRTGDRVRVVGSIDHALVLPKCAVAVHHGGAGTVAATVRAGIPSVVCPFSADQPMWAALLRAQGIGTSVRFRDLNRHTLTRAVAEMLDPAVGERARVLAVRMSTPADAVSAAVDHLERAS